MALPVTLAIFAKNNADSIGICIASVIDHVSEIIVVNTGSSDATVEIAQSFGARVYHIGFTDFGSVRTLTAHLAHQPWVLGLDTDEALCPEEVDGLKALVETPDVDVWGLPRRRWLDIERKNQTEKEAYPDWQYRLIRNMPDKIYYTDRIHERLVVADGVNVRESPTGPHIEHYQDVFKNGQRLKERNSLYRLLYNEDLKHGIIHDLPPIAKIDDK